jgi:hypothetical protein
MPANSSRDYLIESYSYPDGVGKSDDLQHYIIFSINVRGKSKFIYNTSGQAAGLSVNSRRDNIDFGKATTIAKEGTLIFGAGLLIGASAAATSKKNAAYAGGSAAAKTIAVGAGMAAALASASSRGSILAPDNTYRLDSTIMLHIQEKPIVTYGVNYQDRDMGILGGFLTSDASMGDTLTSLVGEAGTAAALQLAKIPSLLPGGTGATLSDIIQLGAKVKTNPFREVFFEGIDYRKFNFRYKFMPKSSNEANQVFNIINLFKEHMHPELSSNGFFYVYPSEFNIEYHFNSKPNTYLNKISTCALTDMSIEYGGEQYATFKDGTPAEINLTLSFRELELMTKETIRMGY